MWLHTHTHTESTVSLTNRCSQMFWQQRISTALQHKLCCYSRVETRDKDLVDDKASLFRCRGDEEDGEKPGGHRTQAASHVPPQGQNGEAREEAEKERSEEDERSFLSDETSC